MNVLRTQIAEVLIIEPKLFGDQRGFFFEGFRADRYAIHGISRPFVQDNISRSAHGVIRGLHLQNPRCQGKLVSVLRATLSTWRSTFASAAQRLASMLRSN